MITFSAVSQKKESSFKVNIKSNEEIYVLCLNSTHNNEANKEIKQIIS